jgi:hypothetical protein
MERNTYFEKITLAFRLRRTLQLCAIATVTLLLVLLAYISDKVLIFGHLQKDMIFSGQFFVILTFLVFSALNWRCPACGRYLGSNIDRRRCRRCGTRLR